MDNKGFISSMARVYLNVIQGIPTPMGWVTLVQDKSADVLAALENEVTNAADYAAAEKAVLQLAAVCYGLYQELQSQARASGELPRVWDKDRYPKPRGYAQRQIEANENLIPGAPGAELPLPDPDDDDTVDGPRQPDNGPIRSTDKEGIIQQIWGGQPLDSGTGQLHICPNCDNEVQIVAGVCSKCGWILDIYEQANALPVENRGGSDHAAQP